jgi:hypothetical protein
MSAGRGAPVSLPAANDSCGLGEGTFASTQGNRQDAAIPDVRVKAIGRLQSVESRCGAVAVG